FSTVSMVHFYQEAYAEGSETPAAKGISSALFYPLDRAIYHVAPKSIFLTNVSNDPEAVLATLGLRSCAGIGIRAQHKNGDAYIGIAHPYYGLNKPLEERNLAQDMRYINDKLVGEYGMAADSIEYFVSYNPRTHGIQRDDAEEKKRLEGEIKAQLPKAAIEFCDRKFLGMVHDGEAEYRTYALVVDPEVAVFVSSQEGEASVPYRWKGQEAAAAGMPALGAVFIASMIEQVGQIADPPSPFLFLIKLILAIGAVFAALFFINAFKEAVKAFFRHKGPSREPDDQEAASAREKAWKEIKAAFISGRRLSVEITGIERYATSDEPSGFKVSYKGIEGFVHRKDTKVDFDSGVEELRYFIGITTSIPVLDPGDPDQNMQPWFSMRPDDVARKVYRGERTSSKSGWTDYRAMVKQRTRSKVNRLSKQRLKRESDEERIKEMEEGGVDDESPGPAMKQGTGEVGPTTTQKERPTGARRDQKGSSRRKIVGSILNSFIFVMAIATAGVIVFHVVKDVQIALYIFGGIAIPALIAYLFNDFKRIAKMIANTRHARRHKRKAKQQEEHRREKSEAIHAQKQKKELERDREEERIERMVKDAKSLLLEMDVDSPALTLEKFNSAVADICEASEAGRHPDVVALVDSMRHIIEYRLKTGENDPTPPLKLSSKSLTGQATNDERRTTNNDNAGAADEPSPDTAIKQGAGESDPTSTNDDNTGTTETRSKTPIAVADFHTHSTFSDGALTPEELVEKCASLGIGALSITDHNETGVYTPSFFEFARKKGVHVLAGSELFWLIVSPDGTISTQEITALFPRKAQEDDASYCGRLEKFKGSVLRPLQRAGRRLTLYMFRKLKEAYGKHLTYRELFEFLCRGDDRQNGDFDFSELSEDDEHWEEMLKDDSFVDRLPPRLNIWGSILEYVLDNIEAPEISTAADLNTKAKSYKKGYFVHRPDDSRNAPGFTDVIREIKKHDGLAVLPHAAELINVMGEEKFEEWLTECKRAGLDGIEAHREEHSAKDVRYLKRLARKLGLFVTNASDFHGYRLRPNVELGTGRGKGSNATPIDMIRELVRRNVLPEDVGSGLMDDIRKRSAAADGESTGTGEPDTGTITNSKGISNDLGTSTITNNEQRTTNNEDGTTLKQGTGGLAPTSKSAPERPAENISGESRFTRDMRIKPYISGDAGNLIEEMLAGLLPEGGRILDLMSGFNTYVPSSVQAEEIVGIGQKREELAANPKLTGFLIQDLDKSANLPPEWKGRFDAVIMTSGMAYLRDPGLLFSEVAKVLKPGGILFIAHNDGFYENEATDAWKNMDVEARIRATVESIALCDEFEEIKHEVRQYDELDIVNPPKFLDIFTAFRATHEPASGTVFAVPADDEKSPGTSMKQGTGENDPTSPLKLSSKSLTGQATNDERRTTNPVTNSEGISNGASDDNAAAENDLERRKEEFEHVIAGLFGASGDEYIEAIKEAEEQTALSEERGQSIVLYADDILKEAGVIDLQDTFRRLALRRNVLTGGKVVIYARDRRNAIILESMIKDADPNVAIIVKTTADIAHKNSMKGKNPNEADEITALMETLRAEHGIKDVLAIFRGSIKDPELFEKSDPASQNPLKKYKVPMVLFGEEGNKGVYSFAQGLKKAARAKERGGSSGWLIWLDPIKHIDYIQLKYERYQATLAAYVAA
ncbi:MAG: PHP domain-containing protein, partial [Candidatus Omnitrophica bacterium]|nr:PHP domain-containing protein [Candidatus Omnitrophota bacterium]